MPQDLVVKLFMSSARAYDACNVSGDAYTFTSKTDGERMWMARMGTVWMFIRRLLGGAVVAWEPLDGPCEMHGCYPVYDVEVVMGIVWQDWHMDA